MKISSLFTLLTPLSSVYANIKNSTNAVSSFQHDIDSNLSTTHHEYYNHPNNSALDASMILNAIEKGKDMYKDGINISKWQSKINGTQIHHDKISFAIIRASEGKTYQDEKFVEYWDELSSNGIKTAAYHNFRAVSSTPQEQVENIQSQLQKVNFSKELDNLAISLPPSGNGQATKDQMSDNLFELLELLKAEGYKNLFINTNNNEWNTHVNYHSHDFSQYKLWISHWTNDEQPKIPQTWDDWDIWQYKCNGRIDGISTDVCMNYSKDNICLGEVSTLSPDI